MSLHGRDGKPLDNDLSRFVTWQAHLEISKGYFWPAKGYPSGSPPRQVATDRV